MAGTFGFSLTPVGGKKEKGHREKEKRKGTFNGIHDKPPVTWGKRRRKMSRKKGRKKKGEGKGESEFRLPLDSLFLHRHGLREKKKEEKRGKGGVFQSGKKKREEGRDGRDEHSPITFSHVSSKLIA